MRSFTFSTLVLTALVVLTGAGPADKGKTPSSPDAGPRGNPPSSTLRTMGQVVLDGVPEIAPELEARVRPWLDTRGAGVAAISDEGDQLLITTRFAETAQVHHLRAPLGARTQLTFAEEPIASAEMIPGTPGSVVYGMDRGGDENFQIFRLDVEAAKTTRLTDGKSRNIGFVFDERGERLAFSSNARNGRDMDIWLSRGKSAEDRELLLERQGHWVPVEFSPDGKRLLIREFLSIAESSLHVVDLATRAVTRVTPETPKASYRAATFARSGDRLYVTSDREGDFVELYELDLGSLRFTPLSRAIRWDVEHLALSGDGRTLAFATNEHGYSVIHLLDTKTRKERPAKGAPRGVIANLDFARKKNVLAFSVASPTSPLDAYTLDLPSGRLTRWTESEVGGLDRRRFVEPTLIEYPSADGRKIPAFFFEPKGTGPFPVLIDIHGGPEAQSRPYFSPIAQLAASELGVAVLVPNVRGSDGYGKTYLSLDDGDRRMDSVKDIGALLDWIATRPTLDAKRVAVHGGSYGGFMVLASLVEYGDRLRAGIDVVGISNMVTFLENTSAYRRDLRRAEYGDERDPKMRAFLESIAPTTNAHRIKSQLFVAQGANDPRVPASEAEHIVRAVRQSGRTVWSMLAKNEGHGFKQKENRSTYTTLLVAFLEQHLLPR